MLHHLLCFTCLLFKMILFVVVCRLPTIVGVGDLTLSPQRVYRLVIRPKLDYGCIVYGAASETQLKSLSAILHEAMRLAIGAFRSTPIENFYILTNEPALRYRRKELLLRYYFKNKCYLLNPAYSCVLTRNLEDYFLSRPINLTPINCPSHKGSTAQTVNTDSA